VTGNKSKEAASNIEKNAGKVQHAVGKAADKERYAEKKHLRPCERYKKRSVN